MITTDLEQTAALEEMINSPAFQAMLRLTEHLGPFHMNPELDKEYRTLRILGFSQQETKELLNNEIARSNGYNQGFTDGVTNKSKHTGGGNG